MQLLVSHKFTWRYTSVLCAFLVNPIVSFCSTEEVPGLSMKEMATPLLSSGITAPPPSSKYLHELLATCQFHGTKINFDVGISFGENKNDRLEDTSEMTNTDLESMAMESEVADISNKVLYKEPILFALNTPSHRNDSRKEYLLQEHEVAKSESSFTRDLCKKLTQDAYHIANTSTSPIAINATTCLCVVLRDEYGRAKKFVFHNGKEKIIPAMERKAKELQYGIRTGYQAHAEGELMQFLFKRRQQH